MTARRYCALVLLHVAVLTGVVLVPQSVSAESAAPGADETAASPNPLVIDPDLAIWTAVVFLVLLAVLGKFAWPPVAKALEERERRIADHIAAAETRHEEARAVLARHEAK